MARGVGKGVGEDLLSKEFEMYSENYGWPLKVY